MRFVIENFSSRQFLRPWDERGDVYLKLGAPSERQTRLTTKYQKIENKADITPKEEVAVEEWTYIDISNFGKPLLFVFEPDVVRGYLSVPARSPLGEIEPYKRQTELQEQMISWVSKVEQEPMQYFFDYGKEELKYAFGLTPFLIRETPNIYDIYLTINVPARKLVTPSLDSIRYVWKVLVQDENYERLFQDSTETVSFLGSGQELDKLITLDQKELRLKAGTYIITSELVNSTGDKGGMLQTRLVLPSYTFPKVIELSKAILAKEIRQADFTDTKFVRNGLVIKPWVSSVFTLGEPIWLYFEIYNLPLDREGKSNFTVKYYLQDLLTDTKYLVSEKIYREAQRDFAMVKSFTDSLFRAAKVPVKSGQDYVLLAEVEDRILGRNIRSLSAMFKFRKEN